VIVAIDLLRRMHIKRQSSFVPLYLFVSHKQKNYFAVLVDRVFSVIKVPKSLITPLSPVIASKISAEYVRGMFMYKEPIKTQNRPDNFMIEPKKEGEVVSVEEPPRPALWLNIPLLLDQQEILKTEGVPD
jgi:chemotaxis signal transduction protein